MAGWHPPSLRTAPAKGIWTPKLSYQRPENGEHVKHVTDPEDEVGNFGLLSQRKASRAIFFWSNLSELPSITDKLQSYPFGDPARWTWGYDESEGADVVLALSLARDGNAGRLEATAEIADLYDTSCRLTTKLQTDCNALDNLRAGLERLVEHRTGECFLLGL